jgi:hypothetical protein
MYLFGSFCDYDLSNRKKSSISAKKPICRVVREKVFGFSIYLHQSFYGSSCVVFFLRAGVSPWNYYTLSEGGRDGWGCRKSLGVCSYYLFLARNIVILQKNRKTEKTHQVFKKFTCRTSKDPRQKISLMYHIFFTRPSPDRKGVDPPFPPPPPGLCIHLLFPPHPWGGTWPRIFTLLTMVIPPAWHLIQKIV